MIGQDKINNYNEKDGIGLKMREKNYFINK